MVNPSTPLHLFWQDTAIGKTQHDPKGLCKLARAGKLDQLTDVSAPYDAPLTPEIDLDTPTLSAEECALRVIDYVRSQQPAVT